MKVQVLYLILISAVMCTNAIRICCYNIRGFNSSVPYIRELLEHHDVLAISEHWLHENKLNKLAEISDKFMFCAQSSKYASAENYGTRRGQGGVALFWSKKLGKVACHNSIVHDRVCGVRLETKNGTVFNILSIYLPAVGSPECFEECLDDLSIIIESFEVGSFTILCGDANADIGGKKGLKDSGRVKRQGKYLLKFSEKYQLIPASCCRLTTGPDFTYEGPTEKSMIDYIFIPRCLISHVESCSILEETALNWSDHLPVSVVFNVDAVINRVIEDSAPRVRKWVKWSAEERESLYTRPLADCMRLVEDYLRTTPPPPPPPPPVRRCY